MNKFYGNTCWPPADSKNSSCVTDLIGVFTEEKYGEFYVNTTGTKPYCIGCSQLPN